MGQQDLIYILKDHSGFGGGEPEQKQEDTLGGSYGSPGECDGGFS